jgi:hypothetical protein
VPLADDRQEHTRASSEQYRLPNASRRIPPNRYQSAAELDADLRAWQGSSGGKKVAASSLRLRMNRIRELPWHALCGLRAS